MKLAAHTLAVLENYASINQGIIIKEGNRLRTLAILENIFSATEVPNEFPKEFALYDINELLATLSLLDDPDLDFRADHIFITSGSTKVKYYYSSPAVVVGPPENDINLSNALATLTLKQDTIKRIQKTAAALKLKDLQFTNEGIKAYNSNNVGNQIAIDLSVDGDIDSPKCIKIDNLKLLEGDYDVAVFDRAIKFSSNTNPGLFYFITVEASK